MTVYLIHLDKPLAHAHHYIGWTCHLPERLAHHKAGTGARMLQVCNQRGITYDVVRTWEGADRNFERYLKNRKDARAFCPVCNPNHYQKNGADHETF